MVPAVSAVLAAGDSGIDFVSDRVAATVAFSLGLGGSSSLLCASQSDFVFAITIAWGEKLQIVPFSATHFSVT